MITAVVVQGREVDTDRARRLAEEFGTTVVNTVPEDRNAMYFLMDKTGITFAAGKMRLKGDLTRMLPRVTDGHLQHEILLKAAKQDAEKQPGVLRAVDCTAGMGEDSFILAAGGYTVELFEHNPVTAVLLEDSLIRARKNALTRDIARRMTVRKGDSKDLLASLTYTPDLIYLDPMFPEKKGSAETKAKLQVLHQIELPCADEEELIRAAVAARPAKIMIKRPPKGPYLGGITPNYSLERKAVRFDCLIPGETK